MKPDFNQRLKEGVIIVDGAMGTMLQRAGFREGDCSEEWNLSHPHIVTEIHRQYIEAGADLILTNTFGANPLRLKAHRLDSEMEKINLAAVALGRRAVELSPSKRNILLAGDLGPAGEFLEPLGSFSAESFYKNFKVQAEVLVKAGVDLIIIETMTGLEEAEICLKAAKESGLPVIVSLSFNKDVSGDNFHTMMGVSLEKMAERLFLSKADGLGINCGAISSEMPEVIKRLAKLTTLPLLAEPNAGLPKMIGGKTIYDFSPEKMAELSIELKKAGTRLIGGCCGTTPDHIRAMARSLK